MKSRILAVLFAAMLVAGTLVGCGSKAAEDGRKQKIQKKIRMMQKMIKILPRLSLR